MIVSLDIETIANPDTFALLPEPTAKKNLKDQAKIAADIAEKKAAQVADAALDALTGRVLCYAFVNAEGEWGDILPEMTDAAETELLQGLFKILGSDGVRLVTWNGMGFDMPFIYKRAAILDVCPSNFNAPPLNAWMKRYSTDAHYDLMQVWGGWRDYVKLDLVAGLMLGERKKEIDFALFPELMKTEEGRNTIAEYCLQDTRLTWRLWERMQGVLFA
jgi:predicted PolB exonuclease-like 3'-5' exonuclease